MDIKELKQRVAKARKPQLEAQKAHKRRSYKRARELGFNSAEARILSGSSIKHIEALAQQRTETKP